MSSRRFHGFISSARVLLTVLIAATAGIACSKPPSPTLKNAYKDQFKIGTAINRAVATGKAWRRSEEQVKGDVALVKAQFNLVVAENDMKWMSLHPRAGKDGYDWTGADAFVAFGLQNNMELAGHTLVWHSQTPNWVFEGTHVPPGAAQVPKPAAEEKKAEVVQPSPPPTAATPPGGRRDPGPGPGGRGFGDFGGFRPFNLNGPRASREELLERMR